MIDFYPFQIHIDLFLCLLGLFLVRYYPFFCRIWTILFQSLLKPFWTCLKPFSGSFVSLEPYMGPFVFNRQEFISLCIAHRLDWPNFVK